MNKYIFLDIDGVINTQHNIERLTLQGMPWRDEVGPYFDPIAVENLSRIIDETQADIVITSSWRHKGEEAMQTLWALRKMHGILVGITPAICRNAFCLRGMEILQWIANHRAEEPSEIRYVIIDDGTDFLPEQMPKAVITNPQVGITRQNAERAIAILTEED